jgi:WD40 repeat protein
LPKLQFLQLDDFKANFAKTKLTEDWVNRKTSNFEYLMRLNVYSGRSFHDCSQYPIFPWILKNYSSPTLDLSDPANYRNLELPMGATDPDRLLMFQQERKQFCQRGPASHLYRTGYSSPLSVYRFLLRQEPFTTLHIDLQGGRFDIAARQFSSIRRAFNTSSRTQNDVAELIPEFFMMPEFLANRDRFDLGRVNDQAVNDVKLPRWAETPSDFVYMMRKALEGDIVSGTIHKWIDLVWGDKQRSERAHNTFMAELYPTVWTDEKLLMAATRAEVEAILRHIGQIPPQLFDKPHPSRSPKAQLTNTIIRRVTIDMKVSNIVAGSITVESGSKLLVATIDESGSGLIARFKTAQLTKASDSLLRRQSQLAIAQADIVITKAINGFSKGGKFVSVSSDSFIFPRFSEVHRVSCVSGRDDVLVDSKADIVCIAADQDWLVVGDEDSMVRIYNGAAAKWTIPTFSNSIECVAVSANYLVIICGTRDGTVLFCSLTDRSIVHSVELGQGATPVSIMITQGWGFVVVYFTRIDEGKQTFHLAVYSINGDLIRQKELSSEVVAWNEYKASDGFDFMVMADVKGNLFWFETFFLQIGKGVNVGTGKIAALDFSHEDRAAVVLTAEGKLILVPMN